MHLHINNCYVRDLKPANIFIDKKGDKLNFYIAGFSDSAIT